MLHRASFRVVGFFGVLGLAAFGALGTASCSCSGEIGGDPGGTGSGTGGAAGAGGSTSTGTGSYSDFPADPQIEDGLPADIPDLFEETQGGDSGGPCLAEPPLEALVPSNWTPLLFEWMPPPEQNVFELRLSVDNQVNDLVVYTTQPAYTIGDDVWDLLTQHSAGHDVRVTLRGARLENGSLTVGPLVGANGVVHIAPVPAPGAIVYWTPSNGAALKGFMIGDKEPTTVLTPPQVGSDTYCIGCHASAPDGVLSFFTRDVDVGGMPPSTTDLRFVDARRIDGTAAAPTAQEVSPVALQLLGRDRQTAPVLSRGYYSPGDAVAITAFFSAATGNRYELAWTDLHAVDPGTGWGIVARTGDPRQAATPTWWHDGSTIAYTSAASVGEGVIAAPTGADPTMDIYTVAYNNRAGGQAMPLPGASDPGYWEYYPIISPDDKLLAFNRCAPVMGGDSYDEPTAEVFVVSATGGTPVRVEGNDPPACTNRTSPGVTNSWPRWAPAAEVSGANRYYWLIFSSERRNPELAQLFVSGVVTAEVNGVETILRAYPALWVASQDATEKNHQPEWDVFQIDPPE